LVGPALIVGRASAKISAADDFVLLSFLLFLFFFFHLRHFHQRHKIPLSQVVAAPRRRFALRFPRHEIVTTDALLSAP
jgi:hypothetical protein